MTDKPLIVLLVEDNLDHAELILRCFRGHHVANHIHHAPDGEAALEYIFRRGEYANSATSPRPHLVLLDLRLPKVDGLQVLKEIKTDPDLHLIPVVVFTTSEAPQDIAGAYANHANSYLVKPMGFDKFTQLMNGLIVYWLDWNRHLHL